MAKERDLLDGTVLNEAKLEVIKVFNGPTEAARIFLEEFAEASGLSRTSKDVLKALAQIIRHGFRGWTANPKEHERRLITSCLRISRKEYDDAVDEICEKMKYIERTSDGGVRIQDEFVLTSIENETLERFAVSRRENGGNVMVVRSGVSHTA